MQEYLANGGYIESTQNSGSNYSYSMTDSSNLISHRKGDSSKLIYDRLSEVSESPELSSNEGGNHTVIFQNDNKLISPFGHLHKKRKAHTTI